MGLRALQSRKVSFAVEPTNVLHLSTERAKDRQGLGHARLAVTL